LRVAVVGVAAASDEGDGDNIQKYFPHQRV
jgi:hypothetical protein